jgi:hypothetical protein
MLGDRIGLPKGICAGKKSAAQISRDAEITDRGDLI